MHRHGKLHLILSLPDGSTSMIPAEWTDANGEPPAPRSRTLGSLADLRQARKVVNVLLKRQEITNTGPAALEATYADGTVSHRSEARPEPAGPGSLDTGRTHKIDTSIGTVARQNRPSTNERSEP